MLKEKRSRFLMNMMLMKFGLMMVVFGGCNQSDTSGGEKGTDTDLDTETEPVDTQDTNTDTESASDTGDTDDTDTLETVSLTTPLGDVVGTIEGDSIAFKGIPYAKPPVGPNRWKKPQKTSAWATPLDATKEKPYCIQKDLLSGEVMGEEDCLTLNIWTPETAPEAAMPVMVYLHGGAFIYGSGAEPMYNGQSLAATSDVVVVTVNYRLGALGFLAHSDLSAENTESGGSGNYALMDQRLALEWVQQNIASFGGDSENVTLFGQSAGAISVGMHLVSEGSWNLFDRAIVQSGPANLFPVKPMAEAEQRGEAFAGLLECDDIVCLRGKPAADLVTAYENAKQFPGGIFFQNANTDNRWGPTVDGDFLAQSPEQSIEKGLVAPVPLMLGTTLNEGPMFLSWLMNAVPVATHDEYYEALLRVFGQNADAVLAMYKTEDFPSASAALAEVNGDRFFVCPTRTMARALSNNGVDTYLYSFEFLPEGMLVDEMGVHHAAEIAFVFQRDNGINSIGESGKVLADQLGRAWKNFAYGGSPNGESFDSVWPKYDSAEDILLVFDQPISSRAGHRSLKCDFWDSL